jgi:DNA-binding PadR family transcriptional regulator
MARKKFSTLTEPMFYLLMSLRGGKKCGIDISEYISRRSSERVKLGPGTLYALLSEFEQERLIKYVGVDGKRKLYELTPTGEKAYNDELMRLRQCLADAKEAENDEQVR